MIDKVQSFYDRYPYPPPTDNLEQYGKLRSLPQRRRAEFHMLWPAQPYREDFTVLVAGCGSSQGAKYAMRWPSAQVIAIDFSATSVRSTEGLKRKYNLANLHVQQLSIGQVQELGKEFDQIVCTGVLHHLADPAAGLVALRNVLRPDGAMHLMLYAPYGRAGIYMVQEFCRRAKIPTTDEGINELIGALKMLPAEHPLAHLLREAPDFQYNAALADALLHPQDRAYSVPQVFQLLETCEMVFGRWLRQAPYSARCGLMTALSQGFRLADLPEAEQSSAAELFRGNMLRHSFIAYRGDRSTAPSVNFGAGGWLSYVPIRVPDGVIVREHLPGEAIAVLLNTSHTARDIFMPICAGELDLVEAIDGRRSIAEIAKCSRGNFARTSESSRLRTLFERLWWHDQVVFDLSASVSK